MSKAQITGQHPIREKALAAKYAANWQEHA